MPVSQRAWLSPDRVLRHTADVRVGTFRCPVTHPGFSTAGPIEGYSVVFPRSAVWIEHADKQPFVADAQIIALYNRGQPYIRRPIAAEGDRSDWLSVSRPLATAIVGGIDVEAAAGPAGPFPVAFAPASAELYFRQRVLFARVRRGAIDDFELEQEVVLLVGAALEQALGRPGWIGGRRGRLSELVEQARELLAREPLRRWTVRDLASRLETSPFHLCRGFRRVTGHTLHNYQLELKVRAALEWLDQPGGALLRLAGELGFASHSHFSRTFRARMKRTPSRARAELRLPSALNG
jgi:AraC family transcriptional regulator